MYQYKKIILDLTLHWLITKCELLRIYEFLRISIIFYEINNISHFETINTNNINSYRNISIHTHNSHFLFLCLSFIKNSITSCSHSISPRRTQGGRSGSVSRHQAQGTERHRGRDRHLWDHASRQPYTTGKDLYYMNIAVLWSLDFIDITRDTTFPTLGFPTFYSSQFKIEMCSFGFGI